MTATKLPLRLEADPRRVIARLFVPGDADRVRAIADRVLAMDEQAVTNKLNHVMGDFGARHKYLERVFQSHFEAVSGALKNGRALSHERRMLIGAYFTKEYSIESVALFNPSLVPHPDQAGLAPGETRFVMSLRACGEGHISSIEFRGGVIHTDDRVTLDPITPFALAEKPVEDKRYAKHPFFLKLIEMAAYDDNCQAILDRLAETFTLKDLEVATAGIRAERGEDPHFDEEADKVRWLAHSNYSLHFAEDVELSERIIFPVTENESRGIEDARFVHFTHEDGSRTYYATYTAYNGFTILPQFIETEDFRHFKIITLNGRCVQNKGMALFPRKIDGEYYMVSRLDGEHLYLMNSDNPHFWNEARKLDWRRRPWEF
ncbi:MAG: glycosidase, partial [Phycisphaerae bacterium]